METSPRGLVYVTLNKTSATMYSLFLQSLAEYALVVFITEWLDNSACFID